MGYDLKAGFVLRGRGVDPAFEHDGMRQQFLAASVAFATALVVVGLTWRGYFARDLVPPVARVYVATIQAGVAPGVAEALLLWAVPGAVLQLAGGRAPAARRAALDGAAHLEPRGGLGRDGRDCRAADVGTGPAAAGRRARRGRRRIHCR